MPQTLRGKIAVVTGAGRGVGSEIAQRLVKSGAKVVLVARSVDQLILTEDLISKTGGFVYSIPADISSENEVESIKRNVKDHLGQTDILVNAAGVFVTQKTGSKQFKSICWALIICAEHLLEI